MSAEQQRTIQDIVIAAAMTRQQRIADSYTEDCVPAREARQYAAWLSELIRLRQVDSDFHAAMRCNARLQTERDVLRDALKESLETMEHAADCRPAACICGLERLGEFASGVYCYCGHAWSDHFGKPRCAGDDCTCTAFDQVDPR